MFPISPILLSLHSQIHDKLLPDPQKEKGDSLKIEEKKQETSPKVDENFETEEIEDKLEGELNDKEKDKERKQLDLKDLKRGTTYIVATKILFKIPILREIVLWMGKKLIFFFFVYFFFYINFFFFFFFFFF